MTEALRRLGLAVLLAALLAGCGGSSRKLDDGQWFGKLVTVGVADRRVDFAPACSLGASGRWLAVENRAPVTIGLADRPQLEIYFRPGGRVEAGHAQTADLRQLAGAAHGHMPDFPPGWFIAVRGGAVAAVAEDSGLRPAGRVVKPNLACVRGAARGFSTLQSHK